MSDSVVNIVAGTLLKLIQKDDLALYRVAIDLDTTTVTLAAANRRIAEMVKQLLEHADRSEQHVLSNADDMHPFVTARLQGKIIQELVTLDQNNDPRLITQVRSDLDDSRYFNPDNLIRTVISVPMLKRIEADEEGIQGVLIELNVKYCRGLSQAKIRVAELIDQSMERGSLDAPRDESISDWKTATSDQYVYARLKGKTIRALVQLDQNLPPKDCQPDDDWHAIYHVWPDFKVRAQIWRSVSTVKADACRRSFDTTGRGIVWAIFDSGIDGRHPHFEKHSNLILPSGLTHMDFMGANPLAISIDQLTDDYGHGTHVAGIIAGELSTQYKVVSLSREKDQDGKILYDAEPVNALAMGVAPECKLLSYKVLDKNGEGDVSTVIAAIRKIQEVNGYGRNIIVHGVNLSLGYDFDPEWFACGQSPVCVEVDRLVRSGVVVVVAAGNTGKGFALTINDPGNADLAVTVGATHRDMPHRYGVSYFSSKGPTGDGRAKPDLLAPGERIISCGAGPDLGTYLNKAGGPPPSATSKPAYYLERSGTSMAAPHVSGIIAGILSIRGEFIGLPEEIKSLLVKNATDLGRDPSFQGGGLVDMMRTIQAL